MSPIFCCEASFRVSIPVLPLLATDEGICGLFRDVRLSSKSTGARGGGWPPFHSFTPSRKMIEMPTAVGRGSTPLMGPIGEG